MELNMPSAIKRLKWCTRLEIKRAVKVIDCRHKRKDFDKTKEVVWMEAKRQLWQMTNKQRRHLGMTNGECTWAESTQSEREILKIKTRDFLFKGFLLSGEGYFDNISQNLIKNLSICGQKFLKIFLVSEKWPNFLMKFQDNVRSNCYNLSWDQSLLYP